MSLIDFRNDFLVEVEARLDGFDAEAATDNQLLAKGALFKMAANIGEVDFLALSALRKLETLSGAQLQTWLGDLSNLAAFYQLLASAPVVQAIAANSTAMASIAGSAHALNAVIANQSVLEIVAANPAAWTAFKAGAGLTATSIPTMTGYSAPSGDAIGSSSLGAGNEYWRAFDKASNNWAAASTLVTNQWVGYKFPVPVFIHTFTLDSTYSAGHSSASQVKNIKLQCSTDGVAWTDVVVKTLVNGSYSNTFDVVKSTRFAYWRLFAVDNFGDATNLSVREIDLAGFQ